MKASNFLEPIQGSNRPKNRPSIFKNADARQSKGCKEFILLLTENSNCLGWDAELPRNSTIIANVTLALGRSKQNYALVLPLLSQISQNPFPGLPDFNGLW